MKNPVPSIISAKASLYRSETVLKNEVEAYITAFDLDRLNAIVDNGTGRFDFNHADEVYEIENYLTAHKFTIPHQGEPIVENAEGVERVMQLHETIAACQNFLAEKAEEEQRLKKQKEDEEAFTMAFFDRFKAGDIDFNALSEPEWMIVKALIANARANIPLSLFPEMTKLQQKIVANTLLSKLEEGAEELSKRGQPVALDAVITACLQNPKTMYKLTDMGEDPQTIWELLSRYLINPKFGSRPEDNNSMMDLLAFLQEPLKKEAGMILAMLMRCYAELQDNDEARAARRELDMKTFTGYRETLALMEEAGIEKDAAVRLLCARIGKRQEDLE